MLVAGGAMNLVQCSPDIGIARTEGVIEGVRELGSGADGASEVQAVGARGTDNGIAIIGEL